MKLKENLAIQETTRSLVYRRLADAFRLPEDDLTGALDELASALRRLGSNAYENAASLKRSYLSHTKPGALVVDYTRLFVGPFLAPAPPYGSVYLEDKRQLMGDSTIDVRRHYLLLGLDLSPDFKEAPDHICAELEFMHVLISQGVEAADAGDYDRLRAIVGHQRVFLEKHLAAWIPAFTAKIIDHAQTGYYRNLGETTRLFIAEELAVVTDLPVPRPEAAEIQG